MSKFHLTKEHHIDNLPDVQQSTKGFKNLPIKKVGMRNVELLMPIWHHQLKQNIHVKATFSSYCNLVENVKGINMSRITRTLVEVLSKPTKNKDLIEKMNEFMEQLQKAHETDNIFIKTSFDFPYYETSYASHLDSPEYVTVILESERKHDAFSNYMTIKTVGMSLCPCSKEMSLVHHHLNEAQIENMKAYLDEDSIDKIMRAGFGAHNQRSRADITVHLTPDFKFIDCLTKMIEISNSGFSAPTKTVLKRPDEKIQTELPYLGGYYAVDKKTNQYMFVEVEGTGPKFVEDISRDMAYELDNILDRLIYDYVVVVNNNESIHSRDIDAVAIISAGRKLK